MSDSDSSGPSDRKPTPAKKSKKEEGEKKSSKKRKAEAQSDDDDGKFELGGKRFMSISEFKGQTKVDIREFYTDDNGDFKPTKKGVSLTMDQWKKLKKFIPKIDAKINAGSD